jgi:L-histidine N-alpha-methyltransferase
MNHRVTIELRRSPEDAGSRESRAVWDALLAERPTINSKYFYDDLGSELFEQITELPEYYQTRTELGILEHSAAQIVAEAGPQELVELGSGAGRKVHLLLDAIASRGVPTSCVLLDINQTFLRDSAERLAADYPEMLVRGVVGDFTRDLEAIGVGPPRLVVFFAGTIGNLEPAALEQFLRNTRRAMVADDRFLVGLDLVKQRQRLEAAYNDAAGVTAAFNRNILSVLNTRFRTDFRPEAFDHVAVWDPDRQWIEMRLRATGDMTVSMPGDTRQLNLNDGDEIRTEISRKFTREGFAADLAASNLELCGWWHDERELFALALARRSRDPREES